MLFLPRSHRWTKIWYNIFTMVIKEDNSEDKRANKGFIAISTNLGNAMSELTNAMLHTWPR